MFRRGYGAGSPLSNKTFDCSTVVIVEVLNVFMKALGDYITGNRIVEFINFSQDTSDRISKALKYELIQIKDINF